MHAKGPRVCLLCHLHVSPTEPVAAAFDGQVRQQQPLFGPYESYLCQKASCFFCHIHSESVVILLHRDCELYRRKFFPDTKLRIADILRVWPRFPRAVTFPATYRHAIAKKSFGAQLVELVKSELGRKDANGECVDRIWHSMAKLPAELVLRIAEYSYSHALQQPATIFQEGRFVEEYVKRGAKGSTHFMNYTGGAVSIQHLSVCGTRYVAGLTIATQDTNHGKRLQPIAITLDEVGVTNVDFDGILTPSRSKSWYKTIQPGAQCAVLLVQVEYIITDISRVYDEDVYWDQPFAIPPHVPTWFRFNHGTCPPMLMNYVSLEDDGIYGITVSWSLRGTVSIHAHKQGKWPDIYKETEEKTPASIAWIYFPLAEKETITAGWIREIATTVPDRQPALVLRTSSHRTCVFGPYVPQTERHRYRFHALNTTSSPPSGICYTNLGMESKSHFKLGLHHAVHGTMDGITAEPSREDATAPLPRSAIPQWFRSCAPLVGAVRARLCVDRQKQHAPCIGMLVTYEDREMALGQWRFDKDIRDVHLRSLVLQHGRTAAGPYVRIAGSRESEGEYYEFSGTEWITWWFTAECGMLQLS